MIGNKFFLIVCLILALVIKLNYAQYSTCSYLESNIDYKGNDLAYSYSAKSPQDCTYLCSALKTCTGFTFWYMTATSQVCFLKNFTTTPTRYPSINRISCIMVPVATTTVKPVITTTTTSTAKPVVTTTTTTVKPVTVTTTTTTVKPVTTTTTTSAITTPFVTTTTTTSLTKCTVEQDAYYGLSDSSDMFAANTVGECCDYCQNYAQPCLAYSFLSDQNVCYVYFGTLPAKQSRPNTLSGGKNPNYSTTTTVSTSTASSRCAFETDAFFGFTDNSDPFPAKSEVECCNLCAGNSQRCVLFSYLADQQVCYTYYGTIQDKVERPNTISGVLLA